MCNDCKGRGRWQETEMLGNELIAVWHYCNTCNGTGIDQQLKDDEPFDIPSNDE